MLDRQSQWRGDVERARQMTGIDTYRVDAIYANGQDI